MSYLPPAPGTTRNHRGANIPFGWLAEDGSAVSRTTYAALFAVLGTNYGSGNGSTTFNLPDSRGRADIGSGTGPGLSPRILSQILGEETHTLSASESGLPGHNHTVNDPGHGHGTNDPSHTHAASSDPHNHSITDPGHTHHVTGDSDPGTNARPCASDNNFHVDIATAFAGTTGITIDNETTNVNVVGHVTGVSVVGNTTGITNIAVSDTPAGSSHNNMQPTLVVTKIIKF